MASCDEDDISFSAGLLRPLASSCASSTVDDDEVDQDYLPGKSHISADQDAENEIITDVIELSAAVVDPNATRVRSSMSSDEAAADNDRDLDEDELDIDASLNHDDDLELAESESAIKPLHAHEAQQDKASFLFWKWAKEIVEYHEAEVATIEDSLEVEGDGQPASVGHGRVVEDEVVDESYRDSVLNDGSICLRFDSFEDALKARNILDGCDLLGRSPVPEWSKLQADFLSKKIAFVQSDADGTPFPVKGRFLDYVSRNVSVEHYTHPQAHPFYSAGLSSV